MDGLTVEESQFTPEQPKRLQVARSPLELTRGMGQGKIVAPGGNQALLVSVPTTALLEELARRFHLLAFTARHATDGTPLGDSRATISAVLEGLVLAGRFYAAWARGEGVATPEEVPQSRQRGRRWGDPFR